MYSFLALKYWADIIEKEPLFSQPHLIHPADHGMGEIQTPPQPRPIDISVNDRKLKIRLQGQYKKISNVLTRLSDLKIVRFGGFLSLANLLEILYKHVERHN